MEQRLRMLVSHSTVDTRVTVLWRFINELQIALDGSGVPVLLVNVVSECGGKVVSALSSRLTEATNATDVTMMVLTPGYVDSNWCDDEMQERASRSCLDCPSRRLFPLMWRNYPWNEVWSRQIEGWGVNLQDLITDELCAAVEKHLWKPAIRPPGWHEAIARTVPALTRFNEEVRTTCTKTMCPAWVDPAVPVPERLD